VEGGGIREVCPVAVGLLCTGRLSRLFLRMCNRFPGFAECQAVFCIHVEGMHLYFNGLPDETHQGGH